jgi:hypothetical protein
MKVDQFLEKMIKDRKEMIFLRKIVLQNQELTEDYK